MFWLAFALLLEVTPSTIPQGQVARVKAPEAAVSIQLLGKSIPLFAAPDGTRTGLIPVPVLATPGQHRVQALDANGNMIEKTIISVQDAHFESQNITLGRSLQNLKPAPGEMETLAALRNTVSPKRYWTEPFEVPVPGCSTSPFGVKRLYNGKPSGNFHSGLDQRSPAGTPIRAITGGVVKIVRKFNINGNIVGIDHGQGMTSFYLHMSKFATTEGATVKKGEVLGYVGSSGRSTAPHLHWAIDVLAVPVNPLQWMTISPCIQGRRGRRNGRAGNHGNKQALYIMNSAMPASSGFDGIFRVGVTPDFYTEAKGRFENILEHKLSGLSGLNWQPMPPQPGNVATSDALNQFDALFALALKFTADSVREVDRLALVARWGVGYDMIDVDALTESDIALAITPAAVRRPVAEAIFTFIFALTTNLRLQDRLIREGKWRGDLPKLGRNIKGRVLGSLGCGNIAREMFRMARSLGFGRMIASDPFVTREQAAAVGAELVEVDELLAESDFLTINTLLNSKTRGFIGEKELRQMKPEAYLINTARGPILQESALVRALKENWIAGAGLDVFEQEPLPQSSPLRELDNVILSPHGLAWTEEIVRDNGIEACNNILAIARGEVPDTIVNKEVIEQPGFQKKLSRYRRAH